MKTEEIYDDGNNNLILIVILVILIGLISSCVPIKPANTLPRAERRVIKLNEGIKNQVDRFPELASKAHRVIVRDTVKVPGFGTEFDIRIINIDSIINENLRYQVELSKRQVLLDSLLNTPLKDYPEECKDVVNDLQNRITKLRQHSIQLEKESKDWFNSYLNAINRTVTGTYEDSRFIVDYIYKDGEININPKVKDGYVVVDKEEHFYDVKIRRNFWQDWKFYPFIALIITLLYFFSDIIFGLINKVVSLVRKLIFKI